MKLRRIFQHTGLGNEKGFLLLAGLVLLVALTLVGTTAYILSATDIKIGAGFRNAQQVFQAAQAGAERGREVLRQVNASQTTGADPNSFNSELVYYADGNRQVTSGTIGNYAYTVRLSNDPGDSGGNFADSNNKVLLTSTATGSNGIKAVVEIALTLPPPPTAPPPPPFPAPIGTISLLGDSASFLGGNSNAKALTGNDACGSAPSVPVVGVSAAGSLANIQTSIANSKPETYQTTVDGVTVNARTNMDAIATTLTGAQLNNNGYTLDDAASLNSLVQDIRNFPQATIVPGGSNDSNVNLGTVSDLKVVVVDGDFTMRGSAS